MVVLHYATHFMTNTRADLVPGCQSKDSIKLHSYLPQCFACPCMRQLYRATNLYYYSGDRIVAEKWCDHFSGYPWLQGPPEQKSGLPSSLLGESFTGSASLWGKSKSWRMVFFETNLFINIQVQQTGSKHMHNWKWHPPRTPTSWQAISASQKCPSKHRTQPISFCPRSDGKHLVI